MIKRSDFDACRHCLCLTARRDAQRLTRSYDEKLRPHGLTINQFSMLTTLILAGPLPVSELAERLGIDRTTLTRNLALCEKAGLIAIAAGDDRRVRLVRITQGGQELAQQALPAWQKAQSDHAVA